MFRDPSRDELDSHSRAELEPRSFAGSQIARRGFVLASLCFLAARAADPAGRAVARSSGMNLPAQHGMSGGQSAHHASPPHSASPSVRKAPASSGGAIPATYDGRVIPRSQWTRVCPNPADMEPLGAVRKITVHASRGPYRFTATGVAAVRNELSQILQGELAQGHKDIVYHYVIDPAGRVWAARDIKYLGKHVRDWKGVDNRTGNVGVMLLGNFEKQQPSAAQVATTQRFVMELQKKYRVPKQKSVAGVRSKDVGVFLHCELSPTEDPGDNMTRAWVESIYPRLITKF
jgi:hypothetical protein